MGEGLSTAGFGGGFTVVTTMKNEAAFLIELATPCLTLGFDRLVICTNDCADPTPAMAARLQQPGHCALRSLDGFFVKRDQGRVNHARRDVGPACWRRFDPAVDCSAIRRYDAAVAGWTARLRADPELDRPHRAAVDWHRARAAELAAQPACRKLRAVREAEGRI